MDMATYPKITCDNAVIGGATQEIHIFLGPLNPDDITVSKYQQAVDEWNTSQHPVEQGFLKSSQLKACHLSLEFLDNGADGKAPIGHKNVCVMQSARYV